MSEYDNELRGVLFKNDQKREGRKDPDYKGNATIGGKEFWISSWINTSKKDGRKYMSLNFRAKEQQQEEAQQAPTPDSPPADFFDDEIPF